MKKNPKPGSLGPWLLVATVIASAGVARAQQSDENLMLEEIIVTAQKRGATGLQDSALSAAVVTSDDIKQRQLVSAQDYLRTIPGATHQEYGAGRTTTIIRGISADPQAGSDNAAVYINETSLTGLGSFGRSSPDLKLVDVSRIEILRGPQGTLYGASSMGGTVRVITEPPRIDEFGGNVTATASTTGGAGSGNYNVQGVFNVPILEGRLALRAVGYHYDYSGYHRNVAGSDPVKSGNAVATGGLAVDRDDAGAATFTGGRLSLRWTPSDRLLVDLTYLEQDIEQEGNPLGDLAIGDFEHARLSRVSTGRGEFNADRLSMLSAQVEYDFGPVGLVSATSWGDYRTIEDWEVGQFWLFLYGFDDPPIWIYNDTGTEVFAQELRIASQWERRLNFVAGLYYQDDDGGGGQVVAWDGDPAIDPFASALLAQAQANIAFTQRALFGELSYELTDTLTATAGLRRFDYEIDDSFVLDGFLYNGRQEESTRSSEDGFTRKVNLSWTPGDESLYYVQWAEGFNPGGPLGETERPSCDIDNDGVIDGLGLPFPEQIDSDTLDSYEIGGKLGLAGGRIDLRAAAYYNDWKKIPVTLFGDCAIGFVFNAAEAMTAGLELEGSALLAADWRLDFSAGYTKAELTKDAASLGMDGDRLPGTPEYSAALGLTRELDVRGIPGFVRADVARVGGFYNNLSEQGLELGDYTTVNLTAGLSGGNWDAQFFVQNLTDASGATWLFFTEEFPSTYRLRPRTVGVTVRTSFGGDR
jgi:outer membrane receptor protein involved in Fe transport